MRMHRPASSRTVYLLRQWTLPYLHYRKPPGIPFPKALSEIVNEHTGIRKWQ